MIRSPVWLVAAAWMAAMAGTVPGAEGDPARPGPPAEGKWTPIPALTDEFDGKILNAAKWHPRNPRWKGRQPGYFHPNNVTVRDGKLHITMRREDLKGLPKGYHTFTCGAVQSRAKVRYGYFEIKCRPMDSKGSSAFWFYDNTPEIWTEIDVFEMGARHPKHERVDHTNLHVFHTLVNPDRHWARAGQWKSPWRLADGYHVYALEWGPKVLRFLVDGQVIRSAENTHWHQPLTLNFDSETMPKWFGLPDEKNLPSTCSIEYVRSWRRTDLPKDLPIQLCEFAFPGEGTTALAGKTKEWTLGRDEAGELVVVARFNAQGRRSLVHLEYRGEKFFAAQKAKTAAKHLVLTDQAGRKVSVTIHYEKVAGYNPHSGYRADRVRIEPADRGKPDEKTKYRFDAGPDGVVEMTVTF